MKKKRIFILLLLSVCLTIAGCGGKRQREKEELFVKCTGENDSCLKSVSYCERSEQ